jgi:hypothetical protein
MQALPQGNAARGRAAARLLRRPSAACRGLPGVPALVALAAPAAETRYGLAARSQPCAQTSAARQITYARLDTRLSAALVAVLGRQDAHRRRLCLMRAATRPHAALPGDVVPVRRPQCKTRPNQRARRDPCGLRRVRVHLFFWTKVVWVAARPPPESSNRKSSHRRDDGYPKGQEKNSCPNPQKVPNTISV